MFAMGFANFLAMASLSIPPAVEADGLGAACCAIAVPDNAPYTRRAQIIFLVFIDWSQESEYKCGSKVIDFMDM